MEVIGKVSENFLHGDFQWKIKDFTTTPAKVNIAYSSPTFTFFGATWYFEIYPNGHKDKNSIGYIDLYLSIKSSNQPISVEYSLIIKTMGKEIEVCKTSKSVFDCKSRGYGETKILKRSEFFEKKSKFYLKEFVVICTMKHPKSRDSSNRDSTKCSYCNKTIDAAVISFHEKTCLDKPVKCLECSDVAKLGIWYEHVCQTDRAKVYEKMMQNFKDIMESGDHSDTVIKVNEVEFRLHKSILAARNPFFNAMFKNEMKEKITGEVQMNDCDPDVFHQFVHFLYTGKVEEMTSDNVCSLYQMADKYQDEQLKTVCSNFMENSTSVENFCAFMTLALKYDEEKLFQEMLNFFIPRANEIVRDVKWVNFAREYPTESNELIIKALDRYMK